MKAEVIPYQRIANVGNRFIEKKSLMQAVLNPVNLLYPLSFMLARVSLAEGLIPFGIAFYAASVKNSLNRFLLAATILFGTLFSNSSSNFFFVSSSMLLMIILEKLFTLKAQKNMTAIAFCALFSVILPEIIFNLNDVFLFDKIIKALLRGFAVFSLTFIFSTALNPFKNSFGNKKVTHEEILGITIAIILAIAGFSSLTVFGVSVKYVLYLLLLLIIGYIEGAGAGTAAGVTMGLIINLSQQFYPMTITKLALCGLLSGILKPLGKIGVCTGLLGGFAIFYIYFPENISTFPGLSGQFAELGLALLLFGMIPKSLLKYYTEKFSIDGVSSPDKKSYSALIKELTAEKLNRFSNAFKEISKTLGEVGELKKSTGKQELSTLFDRVADRVCKDCCLCGYCWDKNFYSTYQVTFKILEKLEDKGRICNDDIPKGFIDKCERVSQFIDTVNNTYEIFKVNMLWKNKMGENKGIISKQLEGLSSMISNLACELSENVKFKSDIEDILTDSLIVSGIKVSDVIVFENKWGKNEINIIHKGCDGKKQCLSTIEKSISASMNKKFVKDSFSCKKSIETGHCMLKLVEEERFSVLTGVSKVGKSDSPISGDNYTFLTGCDGKYILALSDGMGSGISASRQSKAAINLLEQFMESGFDKDTTLNLINSILTLKANEDSFTTIDLSIIDLYNGEVEFIKIGAVPTYIKRGKHIQQIKSFSLPAGIMANIDIELLKHDLTDGDFIIMISDGILDSYKDPTAPKISGDNTLVSFLSALNTANPQEMADIILQTACKNNNDKPLDDMLVMVSKLWQKV